VVQGARYHRQGGQHFNPHTYDDIKTIANHAHYVGDIREHAWWGHEPKGGGATSDAGGGHAHCGAMIYLGDNFPDEYRNRIYFNNVHGNRVNCDILEPKDSGYVGHHGKDLVLANDRWYRGINLRYGPDGSVILIDWYDKNACHRVNPEIWDRTSGRIYRLVYGDRKPIRVDLSQMTDAELTEQLFHRNEWYVRMARRLLMERNAGPRVRAELLKRVSSETDEPRKLQALWTISSLQLLDENLARGLLKDSSEFVRAWTIQLMLDHGNTTWKASGESTAQADSRRPDGSPFYASLNSVMLKTLTEMATTDSSPIVRRYLASALQQIAPDQRWELAQALVQRAEDERDHNIPLLLWYGVEPLVAVDASRAMRLASESKISRVRQYLIRRACSENSTNAPAVELLSAAANDPVRQAEILDAMLEAFRGRVGIPMPDEWKGAYAKLSPGASQEIQDRLSQIAILFGDVRVLGPMRKLLGDPDQDILRRRQALDVLIQGRDLEAATILQSDAVLDHPELQGPAVRGMATLANDLVPVVLLRRYSSLKADSKKDAIATLCARPNWSKSLLQEIAGGKLPTGDLHAFHVRQIQSFQDPQLNELLLKHWGDIRESSADRQKQIAEWKQYLKPRVIAAGSTGNGRRIFARTCQNCHRLFGTGGEIGPDITGANRSSLDYLLENMIDPSSVVGRDYQVVILQLKDGRVINGLVRQDTDSALTIQTINDRIIVPKADIEERSLSSSSMMPEKQLDALTKDEVRDLIAYLQSPAQVTLSGPPAPIDPNTGRVPGALEAEGMKILEKTSGTVSTQAMNGFPKDRWSDGSHLWWTSARPGDHLTIEITAESDGIQDLEAVFTRAPDYGIVQLKLDDQILEQSLDLFSGPDVVTTGVLRWSGLSLKAGSHRLSMEIIGANPAAIPGFMVGLDYVRFQKAETPGQ
ncbi:MAG: PVC-type heme-binding CxxCH protein, partial [Planctomyces sp.]